MELYNVIEDYLNSMNKEKATTQTYRSRILVFYEYVKEERKAEDVNFVSILRTFSIEDFLDSVQYYVNAGNIKFRSTVDIYFSVVSSFYNFIYEKYGWDNDLFQNKEQEKVLKEEYQKKIKEIGLLDRHQEEPIEESVARKILNKCNQLIQNKNIQEIYDGKKGCYSNYVSALIVKLVLMYGLKNDTIRKIKITDYDDALNKLRVNGIWVRLPDKLAIQMKEYKMIRTRILQKQESEKLFFDDMDAKKKFDNTKMFIALYNVTGSNQAKAVAKYAIIEMLKREVPFNIIMKFTGYKDNVLEYCQNYIDEESGVLLLDEKSKILDSSLIKCTLFNDM